MVGWDSVTETASFMAVDLGASSGRLMLGQWDGSRFVMSEVHRFPNLPVKIGDEFFWDVLFLWAQIVAGLRKFRHQCGKTLAGIAIDSWGVDYALLDAKDRLLRNPYSYRDNRTDGMIERVERSWSGSKLFQLTGVQPMQINTLYQLYSECCQNSAAWHGAESLLMIPDLFQFFLSGAKATEYTAATTSQLYSIPRKSWAEDLLTSLRIPCKLFQRVVGPGTPLQSVRANVLQECGIAGTVPVISVASHDTASSVAAIPELDEHTAFLSSGTWSLLGVLSSSPVISAEAFRMGFTNEGAADGGVLLLRNLNGLWILQQCLQTWAVAGSTMEWREIQEAATAAPSFRSWIDINAKDFQVVSDMPSAIVRYCQRTLQPIPRKVGEFARCILESLSFTFRSVMDSLERVTSRDLRVIRLVGGGSLNECFCQMIADATHRVVVAGPVEATALGNVVLQAMATGHLTGMQAKEALKQSVTGRLFEPGPHDQWEEAYFRFSSLMSPTAVLS